MSEMRFNSKLIKQLTKYTKRGILPVVAVSGGIDSITLAAAFSNYTEKKIPIAHATGPAVPLEATKRVKDLSLKYNWKVFFIKAGEMKDPRYLANPLNRCFFCKENLYTSIFSITKGKIVSGANIDDLNDYRPGLDAALNADVSHPYIDSEMNKEDVRKLAKDLGLGRLSELPSSPCLSSRVETGININSSLLHKIGFVESKIKQIISDADLRCRWFSSGVVIEFKYPQVENISKTHRKNIFNLVASTFSVPVTKIKINKYIRGNSFKKPTGNIG